VRLERGAQAELRVVLAVRAGLAAEQLREAVGRVSEALAGQPQVRERVDSLELYPVAVEG
jgi:hypothetical protein